ncbi:MAG: hypothetical protein JXR80_02910 [Deltaproteobacteria bacterium]|nr:hypothetical protein [Deltaproteobacteria bacterium]
MPVPIMQLFPRSGKFNMAENGFLDIMKASLIPSIFTFKFSAVAKALFLLFILIAVTTAAPGPLKADESVQHENILDLVTLLQEKEAALKRREAALAEKEVRIEMLQKELQLQEGKMLEIRVAVEKMMAEFKALKEEDLSRLVEVYTAMKPENAAPLLSRLELKSAVEVILRMPAKKAAKLLSAVEAERAAAISRAIAEIKPVE